MLITVLKYSDRMADLTKIKLVSEAQRLLLDIGAGQRELARICGCSPGSPYGWLHGKTTPKPEQQAAIEKAYPSIQRRLWEIKPHLIGERDARYGLSKKNTAQLERADFREPERRPANRPTPERVKVELELDPSEYPIGSAKRAAKEQLERCLRLLESAESEGATTADLVRVETLIQKANGELAKYSGELSANEEDKLTRTNSWLKLRSVILKALNDYPDAELAVIAALEKEEAQRRAL